MARDKGKDAPKIADILSYYEKSYEKYEKSLIETLTKNAAPAFIAGDLKAQAALKANLSFNLVNKEALKFVKTYKEELLSGGCTIQGKFVPWLTNQHNADREAIARILEEGYKSGKPTGVRQYQAAGKYGLYPKNSIANDLQQYFNIRKNHASMVARTEIARIQIHGATARYKQQSVKKVLWLTFEPCPICEQFNMRVYDIDKLPREIPVHPHCFLPGTRLEAPGGIVSGLRAFYSGQAVKISIADGRYVTVTPNHMLLTPRGFASADQLRKGDYIVYSPEPERVVTIDPDNDDRPTRVEDIFNALKVTSSSPPTSVPAAPEDLHGDGKAVKGEIDIIRPYGLLSRTGITTVIEEGTAYIFNTGPTAPALGGSGELTTVLKSLASATDGGMSSSRKPAPFFGRRLAHTEEHGLGPAPRSNPGLQETAPDSTPVDIENISELINRHPGIIEIQEITDIDIFPFHGYVYDFETRSTLSIGNGFITSNCRCDIAPVPDEVPEGPAPNQKIPDGFKEPLPYTPPKAPDKYEVETISHAKAWVDNNRPSENWRDYGRKIAQGDINPNEGHALHYYTGSGYSPFNKYLRGLFKGQDGSMEKMFEGFKPLIDGVLKRETIPEDVPLFRAAGNTFSRKLLKSGAEVDPGYSSTATKFQSAFNFCRKDETDGWSNVLVMSGKKGDPALFVDNGENEVIRPRGLHFKVIGVQEAGELTSQSGFAGRKVRFIFCKVSETPFK